MIANRASSNNRSTHCHGFIATRSPAIIKKKLL
jgi:hypothetical protein